MTITLYPIIQVQAPEGAYMPRTSHNSWHSCVQVVSGIAVTLGADAYCGHVVTISHQ